MAFCHCPTIYLVVVLCNLLQPNFNAANPPIVHYSHNMRILKIPSNTEPGSIVYRIKASDADDEDVIFDVLENHGKSVLRFDKTHHNEANVVLISPLKENDEFNLTIYATDNQESTYIESRLIATSVPNVTNHKLNPIVLMHNPVYVYENETLNKSITVVKAYDRVDSKLPVTFELLDNSNLFDFRYLFGPGGISTAELVLIGKLDYERQNLHIVTLLAINAQTDDQVDTRNVHTVQLSIVVRDVQDTPPVFDNLPAIIFLDHKHKSDSIIFNVSARDGDTDNLHNVTFAIQNSKQNFLKIYNNGSIFLTLVENELIDTIIESKPIQLDIQATEITIDESIEKESISALSNLIICLSVPNRPPMFRVDQLIGRINEHSGALSAVSWQSNELAHVMDLDQGLNGTIELQLVNSDGTFIIEPTIAYQETLFTLLVNDSSMLDYEERRNISVMIIAKDRSTLTSFETNLTCIVFIDDINDNYPQFTKTIYEGVIYENAKEGTSIATIEASDRDEAKFGQLRFTAIKGIYADMFHIDEVNGIVSLAKNSGLDRELVAMYMVTIEVRDDFGTGNKNSTELNILVLDVNDNSPIFLQSNYLGLVNPDMNHFLVPLQVTAIDIDEINSSNSLVNYEVLHGNYEDLFKINKDTGKISISQRLKGTFSNVKRIELIVRAYDLGVPQMSSTTKVYIYIMNTLNRMKTSFRTRKNLNLLPRNESLEKFLSDITGGNVTITELKPANTRLEPSSIVTSVQFNGNESIVDLDTIPVVFDHFIESDLNNKLERETEVTTKKNIPNQSSKIENHESVLISEIRTSQFGNLDILLWIMVLVILFLLFVLFYLLFLICKDKRQNKTILMHTEVPTKASRAVKTYPVVRKKRKTRQLRSHNKVVDLQQNKNNQSEMMTVTLNKEPEYELQEEKYSSTPNMVTYYQFKRLRYPTKTETKTDNSELLGTNAQLENTMNQPDLQPNTHRINQYIHDPSHRMGTPEMSERDHHHKSVSFADGSNAQFDYSTNHNSSIVGHYDTKLWNNFTNEPLNTLNDNYRQMQRKSIFTITYDNISSRENISASSESSKAIPN